MIYGKRIRLRGVEKTDVPKFYEWINDPEVIENLCDLFANVHER